MDRFVRTFEAEPDKDLMLCPRNGVAYQADMQSRVSYGNGYLAKFDAYDRDIEAKVNLGRAEFLLKHLPKGATVLDVGSGNGSFLRVARGAGFAAKGLEVIPEAVQKLQAEGLFAYDPAPFDAVCFWDSLEHMEDPEPLLRAVRRKAHVFVSIPVFEDLKRIRESKHYRPNEHLTYWTAVGFIEWMELRGFLLIEESAHEVKAGREGIGSFCFMKFTTMR